VAIVEEALDTKENGGKLHNKNHNRIELRCGFEITRKCIQSIATKSKLNKLEWHRTFVT